MKIFEHHLKTARHSITFASSSPTPPSIAQLMAIAAKGLATAATAKQRVHYVDRLRRLYGLAKATMWKESNFAFDSHLFRHVGHFCYCGIDPETNETLWIDEAQKRVLWIPFYETELEMEFDANEACADPKFRYRRYLYSKLRPLTIS